MKPITITVTQRLEAEVTRDDIARAVFGIIIDDFFSEGFDDAGCDWLTDDEGNTYIANEGWHAHNNPECALLVDAANYLLYGKVLKLESKE